MMRHGIALLGLAIIAIAAWTYNVNYNTRMTLDRVESLRDDIAAEREALQVLRVEWAFLNAPERLEALLRRHNDELGLMAVMPESLSEVSLAPEVWTDEPEVARGGMPVPRARPVGWRPAQ